MTIELSFPHECLLQSGHEFLPRKLVQATILGFQAREVIRTSLGFGAAAVCISLHIPERFPVTEVVELAACTTDISVLYLIWENHL